MKFQIAVILPLLSLSIMSCKQDTPAEPVKAEPASPAVPIAIPAATNATNDMKPVATSVPMASKPNGGDPLEGKFSLADATKGLAGAGSLVAKIETSKGSLSCKLFDDKAPNTVANFVGLARGTRPWKENKTSSWVTKPAYDGTTFHRIIKGFMIQGGDQNGNGSGEPGYTIKDELWPGAKHDRAGLLCMANRGHDTNGAQFFITDAAAAHLDNNYTIFGECSPVDTVHAIASVPLDGEKPQTPVTIKSIKVSRDGSAK